MANPNNCATCKHKQRQSPVGQNEHCYMFKDAPIEVCMQHTERVHDSNLLQLFKAYSQYKETP